MNSITNTPAGGFFSRQPDNNTNRYLRRIPPTGRPVIPGYEHLVYSFESPGGDAFFAVLDPYYLTADVPNPDLGGTIDSTQLNWLATQVAQTKATHKFLFIHTPYYYVTGPDPDEPPSARECYLYEAVEYLG